MSGTMGEREKKKKAPEFVNKNQGCSRLTWGFIVVDIDPVQLQVTVTMISTSWVNTVLITDHLPKL